MSSDYNGQKFLIRDLEKLERMCTDTNTLLHISRVAYLARGGFYHIPERRNYTREQLNCLTKQETGKK